jgi:hypothetical protein
VIKCRLGTVFNPVEIAANGMGGYDHRLQVI